MVYDYLIIGAGAAGLFAAANIKTHKGSGIILEKTRRPATKLLMSGSGQCNITHSGDIKEYVKHYGDHGGKIRSCLYKYNNQMLMDFLNENGIGTFTRDDGKVFPKSLDAGEVKEMLLNKAKENGFRLQIDSEVKALCKREAVWIVKTDFESYEAKNVIIATGGCSYPTTGSDGSFFKTLHRDLHVKITRLMPSLAALNVYDYPYSELSGISFENASISIWEKGKKKIQREGGAMLFTHQSFSGPLIINNSRYMESGHTIKINYVYPLTLQQAAEQISLAMKNNKSGLANVIADEFNLPRSFTRLLCDAHKGKTKMIAARLTEDTFSIKSTGGFGTAMATAGGIDLSEINMKTMEFKKHKGLYAIGECLDIDGDTGGYNLQFAYSSALTAVNAIYNSKEG